MRFDTITLIGWNVRFQHTEPFNLNKIIGGIQMKRVCNQCQTEMIEDCSVNVERGMYGIKITQKGQGIFNNVSAKPKAAICPKCGYVAFYIDEFKEFKK